MRASMTPSRMNPPWPFTDPKPQKKSSLCDRERNRTSSTFGSSLSRSHAKCLSKLSALFSGLLSDQSDSRYTTFDRERCPFKCDAVGFMLSVFSISSRSSISPQILNDAADHLEF